MGKLLLDRLLIHVISLTDTRYTSTTNGCSGISGGVPRLGFPGICLQDAGNGVRGTDGVNGYPSGVHVGASWNKQLTSARAQYMGAEFKRKGVNVALGPVVGPIGRTAKNGRNWEGKCRGAEPKASRRWLIPFFFGRLR